MSQPKIERSEKHFTSLLAALGVLRGVADAIDHGRGRIGASNPMPGRARSDPMPALVVDAHLGLAVYQLSSLVSDRSVAAKLSEAATSLIAEGLRAEK